VDTEERILEGLLDDLNQNRLILPTLPEVALKVRDAVESDNASSSEITRIISMDAALSARLLQLCNSPLYRTRQTIENLQSAVTRLGHIQVRNMVSNLVMQQMFQATTAALNKQMRSAWEHSTRVAAICFVIAETVNIPKDQALLAGLIHDIGTLPIIVYAEGSPELRTDPALIVNVIQKLHTQIGEKILQDWQFPQSLIDVASLHENLDYDPEGKADYVDIVIVANLYSYIDTPARFNQTDWEQIPAFRRLGIDPNINLFEDEDNQTKLQEVRSMLSY